jgi:hypothetical protein
MAAIRGGRKGQPCGGRLGPLVFECAFRCSGRDVWLALEWQGMAAQDLPRPVKTRS